MIDMIRDFIQQKKLSQNSQQAYFYDLEQFRQIIGDEGLNGASLDKYVTFLESLKSSAQKRKRSTVNQFLYYLYQKQLVSDFYRLDSPTVSRAFISSASYPILEDWSILYDSTSHLSGRLIAILILELGLLPSELLQIKVDDIDLTFRVMTIQQGQLKRILALSEKMNTYLQTYMTGVYLFDNKGKPYTRQWVFNQLSQYLETIHRSDWTAQKLREQFMLKSVQDGLSILELAKHLGLKTTVTLEKYYQSYGY